MKKIKFQTVLLVLGIALVLAAAVLLIVRNRNIDRYQERAQSYVNTLREIMPPPQDAVPEERRNNTMSVLSVDGVEIIRQKKRFLEPGQMETVRLTDAAIEAVRCGKTVTVALA